MTAYAASARINQYRVERLPRALGAKGRAVVRIVGAALANGRRIVGFPHHAAQYLAYYMTHDAHHRGQIAQLARQLGHPISQQTMVGMWQWARRAAELGR